MNVSSHHLKTIQPSLSLYEGNTFPSKHDISTNWSVSFPVDPRVQVVWKQSCNCSKLQLKASLQADHLGLCVSDGLSNTFTASNQLFSFAQQYRYVPINFYNRIKNNSNKTV